MADVHLDAAALAHLQSLPQVAAIREYLANVILDDAQANIKRMNAYQSGELYRSREVHPDGDTVYAGFDVPYAHVVHNGLGRGKNDPPRTFLADAAFRKRAL
jgi:hypothetical protein